MAVTFNKVQEDYGWLGNMSPYPVRYDDAWFATAEHVFQYMRFEGMNPIEFKDKSGNVTGTITKEQIKAELSATRFDLVGDELAAARRGVTPKVRRFANPLIAKNVAKSYLKHVRTYKGMTAEKVAEVQEAEAKQDIANMKKVIRLKVAFHSELIRSLLTTKDDEIIEDVTGRVETRIDKANEAVQNHTAKHLAALRSGDDKAIAKASKALEEAIEKAKNPNHRHDLFWGKAMIDGEWVGESQLGKLWMELRAELKAVLFI